MHRNSAIAVALTINLLFAPLALAGNATDAARQSISEGSGPRLDIDDVSHELKTGADAIFDPIGNFAYDRTKGDPRPWYGGPCLLDKKGFSASDDAGLDISGDGTISGPPDQGDAFDGGLFIEINGTIFNAKKGAHKGEALTVHDTVEGFAVTRTLKALPSTPALREYTSISNPSTHQRNVTVTFDSGMGADDAEATRGSSSGDALFGTSDRWFVASDDATIPGDAVVTFVLSGRGAPGISKVVYAPETDTSAICEGAVAYSFHLTVPAGSTAALLTFTELNVDNATAITAASKYDPRGLAPELLKGLSAAARTRIVNWDL